MVQAVALKSSKTVTKCETFSTETLFKNRCICAEENKDSELHQVQKTHSVWKYVIEILRF